MNYKAIYNIIIDDIRTMGFNHRTKWVKQKDGSIKGEGVYIMEQPDLRRNTGTYGNCVRENLTTYAKLHKAGAKFIQGLCKSRMGEWATADDNKGMAIYHCWVELGDKAYDYSNGVKEVCDIDLYYLHRRVVKSEEVRITIRINPRDRFGLEMEIDSKATDKFYKKIKKEQRRLGYYASV